MMDTVTIFLVFQSSSERACGQTIGNMPNTRRKTTDRFRPTEVAGPSEVKLGLEDAVGDALTN
jgi:hypothetical protein